VWPRATGQLCAASIMTLYVSLGADRRVATELRPSRGIVLPMRPVPDPREGVGHEPSDRLPGIPAPPIRSPKPSPRRLPDGAVKIVGSMTGSKSAMTISSTSGSRPLPRSASRSKIPSPDHSRCTVAGVKQPVSPLA
jgi:hypothetical protein